MWWKSNVVLFVLFFVCFFSSDTIPVRNNGVYLKNFIVSLQTHRDLQSKSRMKFSGPVAQLVMRRIRIAEISGSIPLRSTNRINNSYHVKIQ
jgi:hypothetical protein